MLNYDEIVTHSAAHRNLLLTNAEQQWLAQALTGSQSHSISAWIGCQRINGRLVIPLLAILLWWFVGAQPALGATLSVCPSGCPYSTINAAVAVASPGDTITIGPGTYAEKVVIDKDLTLQGAGSASTSIGYHQAHTIVTVASNRTVKLSALTIRDGHTGIRSDGTLTLQSVFISNNSRGITNSVSSILTINQSTIEKNLGAIFNHGNLSLIDSTVRDHLMYTFTTITNGEGAIAQILNSTITNNRATVAMIYNWKGFVQVTNSTIGNSDLFYEHVTSAVLENHDGYLGLSNSTITANYYALAVQGKDALVAVDNSVLATASGALVCALYEDGRVSSKGHNIARDNSCGLNPSVDKIGVDPLLGPLQDNGGPTWTHTLLPGSPALDAGDCLRPIDQRGLARPQGESCDIGAFEHRAPIAHDDSYTTYANKPLLIDVAHGLLANDDNPDNRSLTVTSTSNPLHGRITFNAQDDFQYTPNVGFTGTDTFTYQVSDGYVRTISATVMITVLPIAAITIVLDARTDSPTDLTFSGSLGAFALDDATLDDGDAYTNTRTFLVPPGNYSVIQSSNGWYNIGIVCTPASNATIDFAQNRATVSATVDKPITCLFTAERTVSITARSFNDLVRTGANLGVRNTDDPWLNGWLMSIYLTPNTWVGYGWTTYGTMGGWTVVYQASFVNLRPGAYTVCTTLPTAAWTPTSPNALDPAYRKPCKTVTLAPGQGATLLFGAYQATVGASAVVTPDQEVITDVDQITDLPLTADEAVPLAPTPAEQSGQINVHFLPLVVAGQDNLLVQDEPGNEDAEITLDTQEVVSLSANLPHNAYLPLVTH